MSPTAENHGPMDTPASVLLAVLTARVPKAAGEKEATFSRGSFVNAFAAAARTFGKANISLTAGEQANLVQAGVVVPSAFPADTAARLVMLLGTVPQLPAGERLSLLDDCHRRGDSREKEAVLRSLAFMPEPLQLLTIGVESCRTNVLPVFEAIACDNAYPAAHFPEASFNQMVLKAVFLGVSVDRIAGLDGRLGPELARMAASYASERRAAGRTVPADLDRLLLGNPT